MQKANEKSVKGEALRARKGKTSASAFVFEGNHMKHLAFCLCYFYRASFILTSTLNYFRFLRSLVLSCVLIVFCGAMFTIIFFGLIALNKAEAAPAQIN